MFGPLLAAGLFSSMAGSAIGAAQNNNNIRRQLAFQKAENQKTREYNMMLARYQNRENLAQWNRQNYYNLPEKQMQRLRQAGLNPDLMYSNGTVGNSMSSPEMTSGAPASPMDYSALGGMRTFGDVITQTLNNEMQRAQIKNVEADTNKKEADTNATEVETAIAQAREGRDVELFGFTIRNTKLLGDKTDAEIKSIFQGIENMKKDVDRIISETDKNRALIKDLDHQQKMRVKEDYRRDLETKSLLDVNDATIKKLCSERNLNVQKLKEAIEVFPLVKSGLESENNIKSKEFEYVSKTVEIAEQDVRKRELEIQSDEQMNWWQRSDSPAAKILRGVDYVTGQAGRIFGASVTKSLNKAPITQRVTNNNIYNNR